MKTLWIVAFALVAPVVHGQGTILFSNRAGVLDAPVRNAAGELVPTNFVDVAPGICRGYFAELLVGSDPASVAPFSSSIVRKFSLPGYFGAGDPPVSLPGYPPGSHPWFMVRVLCYADFCPTTGQVPPELVEYGRSGPFQLDPSGSGLGDGTSASPAPLLDGLQSIRLESHRDSSPPWLGTPRVVGTNVVFSWGGARTVLRDTFLVRSSRPDGPWLVVTNAQSLHEEPYQPGAAAFFRVVTLQRAGGGAPLRLNLVPEKQKDSRLED